MKKILPWAALAAAAVLFVVSLVLLSRAQHRTDLAHRERRAASDRLIIMPGGCVDSHNARQILEQTGAMEIHGSASGGTGVTQSEEVARILRAVDF